MEMQIKLDGQSVTSTMDVKSKIKERHWLLLQIALLRSVSFVSVVSITTGWSTGGDGLI